MTSIQVADETFVAAAPAAVAEVVGDPANWRIWWPDLRLSVAEDRGASGVRWTVSGAVVGTMEVWCEPVLDGFTLHYFLHAEPGGRLPDAGRGRSDRLAALNTERRVSGKAMAFAVKDRLEAGREVGGPAVAAETI